MANPKLSKEQVREIYWRYRNGESEFVLAHQFSVHSNTVKNIVLGKSWKWLKLEPIWKRNVNSK